MPYAYISYDRSFRDRADRPVFQAIMGIGTTEEEAEADALYCMGVDAHATDDDGEPLAPPMTAVPCTERLAAEIREYGWNDQACRWLDYPGHPRVLDLEDDE